MTTTKNQQISFRILTLIAGGMSAVEALRVVLGNEATDAMIDRLYSELRKGVC